ncbi:MAG: NUDIX hydrolase [Geminicoccaceae bacterium]|nr:NUDIX hydrolase [Geminicoccaceae bacterium]
MSRLYPERPIVGVGTVVWHGDDVLLVRRGKPPRVGQWSLPGGAQKLGETIAEAARREIAEEAGIEVALGQVIATLDLIERDPEGRVRFHYTLVDFVAEALDDVLRPGGDAADARWFALDRLPELGLWSETLRIIELARGERPCR